MEKGRECSLVATARAFMSDALGFEQHMVFEEIPSPWGRPDLVGIRPSSPSPHYPGPIGRKALSLISLLETEGAIAVDDLVARLGMTRRSLVKLLRGPLAASALQTDGENLSLGPKAVKPLGRICAVEIKLRDWRGGLNQAMRYKAFSDEVYVFLGDLPKLTPFDAFRRSGVGLARLTPSPRLVVEGAETTVENVGLCRRLVEENISKLAWGPMQRPF